MYWKVFILMLLCHVVSEFVLSQAFLAKVKKVKDSSDGNYYMGLAMNSILWSAMILLPIIFFIEIGGSCLYWIFFINGFTHYILDDLNREGKITFYLSQIIYLCQILLTFLIIICILF